jgi:short-subunit dehydrogenase
MSRVVAITGASDGIGAEMARQLAAREGSALSLVLTARNQAALDEVAQACRGHGTQVLTLAFDVRDRAACRALPGAVAQAFGRLDVLVNNAGVSAHAMLGEVAADDLAWYEDVMAVNFWGTVWCTHAALPLLRASRGQVVAVSSLAGLVGVPGRTAYCASKFAVGGFMEALRTEEAQHGVAVTVAYPGVVATRIRLRGYNARGQAAGASGLREDDVMPVETCARLILDAMNARQRDVVMTAKGKLGRWLKLVAPGWVDRLAWQALQRSA